MLKNDLVLKNPLQFIREDAGHILVDGQFGAILAGAGVGKTSFLVQLALDSLLSGKNVLHICLDQPIKKVCLWYEEVLHLVSEQYHLANTNKLWETILPHRFIMTFKLGEFGAERLEERLNDLIEQGIFFPQMVLIDDLTFDKTTRGTITKLSSMAREQGFPVWLTVKTQGRGREGRPDEIPPFIDEFSDLFEVIIRLDSEGPEVRVHLVKGHKEDKAPMLMLDPATQLIKDRGQ